MRVRSYLHLIVNLLNEMPDSGWFIIGLVISGPAFVMGSFVYLLIILFPVHRILTKKGADRWWIYTMVGLACALAVGISIDLFTGSWSSRADYVFFASVGCVVLVTFWGLLRP